MIISVSFFFIPPSSKPESCLFFPCIRPSPGGHTRFGLARRTPTHPPAAPKPT